MNISDIEFLNYVTNIKNMDMLQLFSKDWMTYHEHIVYINIYLHNHKDIIDITQDERMNVILKRFEIILRDLIKIYFIRFLYFEKKEENISIINKNEKVQSENIMDEDTLNHIRISSYILMYHELCLLNIIEFILYSDYVYDHIETYMINIISYVYSNLISFLGTKSEQYFVKPISEMFINEMVLEEEDNTYNVDKLKIYLNIINILRNITDKIHLLNNTVVNKIVDYDMLLILIPLIEKKPWRHQNYVWIRTDDHTLCSVEKQLWLILYTLILSDSCQQKYEMTNYRRNNILKLRKYMNEHMYEQLPPIKSLHTFIEHLYISTSIFPDKKNSYLMIDVVPEIFDEIKNDVLKNKKDIMSLFNNIRIKKELLKNISEVYLSIYEFDQENKRNKNKSSEKEEHQKIINQEKEKINETEKKQNDVECYLCNNCKGLAELQCSQCKKTYYCSKECQMKDWINHRDVCSNNL
ncbi:MYND finger protein,putative [Plasmodium gaboni]|uniref:MYND finger protein,putative n=1 Tax=Plasmodium gaboni TaxID=647221 RepID=A0ABY1UJB6_9APIC|nr:MYND finger protein,putative [Plasmodium gaboni]